MGQDSFILKAQHPGMWPRKLEQIGKKSQRTVLLRASKWDVACNPDSSCYSSLILSLQSGKHSTLCSSDFGANFFFCAEEYGERSLEKGNVCAWGGGESQANAGVILCPSFCQFLFLKGRDSVLLPFASLRCPHRLKNHLPNKGMFLGCLDGVSWI